MGKLIRSGWSLFKVRNGVYLDLNSDLKWDHGIVIIVIIAIIARNLDLIKLETGGRERRINY